MSKVCFYLVFLLVFDPLALGSCDWVVAVVMSKLMLEMA